MSQSANADDSLLLGTAARRQELYPDSGNYDATLDASAPSTQQGAPVFTGQAGQQDNSSGSGNATILDTAPPPPTTAAPSFGQAGVDHWACLLYTSPSPRDQRGSRMPSSA